MPSLTLFSPAKVNLFFRVLGKREDGYHEIATLIQMVDLCDTLSFSLAQGEDVFTSNTHLSFSQDNLIYKAVELFRKHTGLKFSIRISLDKKIPMQAGLGGGSSNAATTLYALNQLLNTNLSDETLSLWGKTLGADVPCFFSLGRVFCEGIGEKLSLQEKKPQDTLYILKPKNYALATPEVFRALDLRKISTVDPKKILADFNAGMPCYINDLELAAKNINPSLFILKNRMEELGFDHLFMTGSGSAFVGIGNVKSFHAIEKEVDVFPVKTLYRSESSWF